jgi:hypothetical protein
MILAAVIGALLPLVITSLFFGLAFYVTTLRAEPGPDARAEYYRAVYDVCVYQTGQREKCLEVIPGYIQKRWYEDPSPGWEWPLPSVQPTPERPARNLDRQGLQNG